MSVVSGLLCDTETFRLAHFHVLPKEQQLFTSLRSACISAYCFREVGSLLTPDDLMHSSWTLVEFLYSHVQYLVWLIEVCGLSLVPSLGTRLRGLILRLPFPVSIPIHCNSKMYLQFSEESTHSLKTLTP